MQAAIICLIFIHKITLSVSLSDPILPFHAYMQHEGRGMHPHEVQSTTSITLRHCFTISFEYASVRKASHPLYVLKLRVQYPR